MHVGYLNLNSTSSLLDGLQSSLAPVFLILIVVLNPWLTQVPPVLNFGLTLSALFSVFATNLSLNYWLHFYLVNSYFIACLFSTIACLWRLATTWYLSTWLLLVLAWDPTPPLTELGTSGLRGNSTFNWPWQILSVIPAALLPTWHHCWGLLLLTMAIMLGIIYCCTINPKLWNDMPHFSSWFIRCPT